MPGSLATARAAAWAIRLKLPVTKSGDIDYEFMENYISAQKKLAVLPILDNQNSEYHYSPDFGVLEVAEEKEYK